MGAPDTVSVPTTTTGAPPEVVVELPLNVEEQVRAADQQHLCGPVTGQGVTRGVVEDVDGAPA